MEANQRILFDLLLEKVGLKLQENHPEVNIPMSNWKGEEIALLREDLQEKVVGTISEKWYYTHIKNQQDKLPRVDTLNLLCQYVDEQSWKAFVFKFSDSEQTKSTSILPSLSEEENKEEPELPLVNKNKLFLATFLGSLLLFILILAVYSFQNKEANYRFCFIDKNTHLPVVDSFLEIKLIKGEETPLFFPLKSSCVEGTGNKVDFIIKGRFYKSLHIKRTIQNSNYEESIFIEPDDYTMMLHLFANSKVKDWKKRRNQLAEMMHDHLKAYEMSKDGFTIDILTKKEFINKMTLPTRSLKQVAIVNTSYEGEKISLIKFTQE